MAKIKKNIIKRPPVVSIVGHVDHGKTTLLDYLRQSKVALAETGGITQAIGAYQLTVPPKDKKNPEKIITFIDTPGHAAFTKLRCRGVQATDIAILVVSATEGVKPQTVESINHIKLAGIPFLVAVNKMDLPDASPDMVKAQLAEKEVLVEGYGGEVVCVPISAKTGQGIEELLEMILLLWEMNDFDTDLDLPPEGIIIEAKMDIRRGPVATMLVKKGIFKIGDLIRTSEANGKIKSLLDETGKKVSQAEPSKPVEVLGFSCVPQVGSCVSKTKLVGKNLQKDKKWQESTVCQLDTKEEDKRLKIILKTDFLGSLEAIKDSLPAEINLIYASVGQISESDILLAKATGSLILAFRVGITGQVSKLAEYEKVNIKLYDIIYKLLEDLEKSALKILQPDIDEEVLGEAKIIAEFKIKGNHIAGCQVLSGVIKRKSPVHVKRNGQLLANRRLKFLQKQRQEVQEGKKGDELGIVFDKDVDFDLGDVIISYNPK